MNPYETDAWFACGCVEDAACMGWLLGDFSGRVLDVGCAGGAFCGYAAARGCDATGVDSLPVAISHARAACPGGTFLPADALALPFEGGAFGGAHMGCMGPVLGESLSAAIREVYRVLKPGGLLFMGDMGPAREWEGFALLRQRDATASLKAFAARWIWNGGGPLPFCGKEQSYTLAVYERR